MSLNHQGNCSLVGSPPLAGQFLVPLLRVKISQSGEQCAFKLLVVRHLDAELVMSVPKHPQVVLHGQVRTQMMVDDNLQRHREQNALPPEINSRKICFYLGIMTEEVFVEALAETGARAGKDQFQTGSDVHRAAPGTGKTGLVFPRSFLTRRQRTQPMLRIHWLGQPIQSFSTPFLSPHDSSGNTVLKSA